MVDVSLSQVASARGLYVSALLSDPEYREKVRLLEKDVAMLYDLAWCEADRGDGSSRIAVADLREAQRQAEAARRKRMAEARADERVAS